jgi:hypothetical protein
MNSKHHMSLAEQYVSLSNTHNLDDSMFLFSEGVHYLSLLLVKQKAKGQHPIKLSRNHQCLR